MELHEIIKGCVAMEQAVANIYTVFARRFPGEKNFWEDLSQDEDEHASWLRNVNFFEMIDLLPSEDMLPTRELIQAGLKFAESKNRYLRSNPVELEDALQLALRLEETMVEVFANHLIANVLSTSYESLSQKLIMAEKVHIGKIEDLMIAKGFLQLS